MHRSVHRLVAGLAAVATSAAVALACGAPPEPPPPPPAPPVVCCVPQIVICIPGPPGAPPRYRVYFRYFLRDGGPLYQSNPMPLDPGQQCICVVNAPANIPAGSLVSAALSFGAPNAEWCNDIPPNVPGYGPFQLLPSDSGFFVQALEFVNIYNNAAKIPPANPDSLLAFGFGGPGQIPPNEFFDIWVCVELPPGVPPDVLRAPPGPDMSMSLFLGQPTGELLVEPVAVGLPPVPIGQFAQNPGASAFYRVRPYRWTGPLCVLSNCPSDLNGDGRTDGADLAILLGGWGPCP